VDLALPTPIKELFDQYEGSKTPFHEHDLAAAIQQAAGPPEKLTDSERRAAWAEMSAFNFMRSTDPDRSVWATYFAPSMTATTQDGTEVYSPDIRQADGAVIAYWESRSDETRHPILRARYADLVWDFGRLVTQNRPQVIYAQRAIDGYIEAINGKCYFHDSQAEDFAGRAISLALSINDDNRISTTKKALFDLYAVIGDVSKRGLWWLLFDNLYGVKQANLSEVEQQSIVDGLEHVLEATTNRATKETFAPFIAQGAAERLERHYRRICQQADVHRVVRAYGQAFENAARDANPLLAMAWLQPVFEKYLDLGLKEDAARIHRVLESRGPDAQAGMQRVAIPVQINMEDAEKFAEALTAGDQRQALRQIGMRFIPQVDEVHAMNEQMMAHAPLSTLIPIRRFEAGHVVAVVGSQDEDPDGRLIFQTANRISFEVPWLAVAFDKLKTRHGLEPEQIVAVLIESPLFGEEQGAVLVEGISAWFGGDHVKAIHVLVPQVERAIRRLASLIGIPITGRRTKGTMQIRGLGELLHDDLFAHLVDNNLQKYLLAFLADQRGINLRNRVAHGLLEHSQMGQGLSDRLVQVLLALACLEPKGDEEITSPA
jgi:lysyl-tRNA synthetase class 1